MNKLSIPFVLLACLLLTCARPAGADEAAGQVLTVKGQVLLLRAGQQAEARVQDPLYVADAVETGPDSRAKLFFRDDSVLNLGAQSRVRVQEYLYSTDTDRSRAVYDLLEGSLKAAVGRSDLEIHTPTAVAAARGTRFLVVLQEAAGRTDTLIMVLEGEVAVRNILREILKVVTLREGEMTRVPTGQPPADPSPTPPGLLRQHRGGTLAIGEVFRDAAEDPFLAGADRPGRDGPRGRRNADEPPVMEAMEDLGLPPLSQEPIRALGRDTTDVNVRIQFPEGR